MQRQFWTPDPIFTGRSCFVIGGGPSLKRQDISILIDRNVIAVNCALHLVSITHVLFFNDVSFFYDRRFIIENWPGLVVTVSREAYDILPNKIKRIKTETRKDFPVPGSDTVRQGASGGQKAVSLAVAMGASRVVLLGFDMQLIDGRSHFHDEYKYNTEASVYESTYLPAFKGWKESAKAVGVDIVNATPGSALHEFDMVSLEDELR